MLQPGQVGVTAPSPTQEGRTGLPANAWLADRRGTFGEEVIWVPDGVDDDAGAAGVWPDVKAGLLPWDTCEE